MPTAGFQTDKNTGNNINHGKKIEINPYKKKELKKIECIKSTVRGHMQTQLKASGILRYITQINEEPECTYRMVFLIAENDDIGYKSSRLQSGIFLLRGSLGSH